MDYYGKLLKTMEGKSKRGRAHREWAHDMEDSGDDTLQKLAYHLLQNGDGESSIKLTLEAYEHDAHGA